MSNCRIVDYPTVESGILECPIVERRIDKCWPPSITPQRVSRPANHGTPLGFFRFFKETLTTLQYTPLHHITV
jgi:hypothetical protein